MGMIAPKWIIWVSFILFCIGGVGIIFYALLTLRDLAINPLFVFGNLIGQILVFYLLIYIPARSMYDKYLKK